MTKRMLVDATHPEEIRVAIVQDNKLIDLDIETSSREQIKGNIYLARVSRVEPSLQAAFIDFGAGRQGFLSVNDIHPKYYPTGDKSEPRLEFLPLLLPEPLEEDGEEEEYDEFTSESPSDSPASLHPAPSDHEASPPIISPLEVSRAVTIAERIYDEADNADSEDAGDDDTEPASGSASGEDGELDEPVSEDDAPHERDSDDDAMGGDGDGDAHGDGLDGVVEIDEDGAPLPDTFKRFPRRQRLPIQKILTRGQKLLVQVVKEPRGNKGASLTTNLSLAGRYAVLLPENEGGGGISRKITDGLERKKLKEILETIAIPGQVSLIIRTAGLGRTKREIIRDLNYLLRLWKKILENASQADGPTLIHEEADLILRTIRDLYATDMSEILIDGQEGYRRGKDFMRLLMPRYMKVVQPYKESQPIFSRFQIENQIESMHDRVIQLKAGGYLVIEATEALVSIDINSGRSTREKDVETTAFKTNLQAADEIARQLRLRDLGGLIVIDFIDMEEKKHNLEVERQMREALKLDRAKIQLGKISQFGLLELSRQRMKPTFSETNRMECPRCKGLGTIRSVESSSIHLFRLLEEDISKNRYTRIVYRTSWDMANYLLNHKRAQLAELEVESKVTLLIQGDESLQTPEYRVERTDRPKAVGEEPGETKSAGRGSSGRGAKPPAPAAEEGRARGPVKAPAPPPPPLPPPVPELLDEEEDDEESGDGEARVEGAPGASTSGEPVEKKKRRRRRRRKSGQQSAAQTSRVDAEEVNLEGEASEDSVPVDDAQHPVSTALIPEQTVGPLATDTPMPVVSSRGKSLSAGEELIEGVRATAAPGLFILARPEPRPEPTVQREASLPIPSQPDETDQAGQGESPESSAEPPPKTATRRKPRSRSGASAKAKAAAGVDPASGGADEIAPPVTEENPLADDAQPEAKPVRRRSPRKPKATPEPVLAAVVEMIEPAIAEPVSGEEEESEEVGTDGKTRAPRRRRRRRSPGTARRGEGAEGDDGVAADKGSEAETPPWES
ncbi:MAG: Rne/Rng family ribonuclease [Magnetococcales bacterium]|nr:Rne/Rng family ribonuclease [Magnetococcales bacterium]